METEGYQTHCNNHFAMYNIWLLTHYAVTNETTTILYSTGLQLLKIIDKKVKLKEIESRAMGVRGWVAGEEGNGEMSVKVYKLSNLRYRSSEDLCIVQQI